MTDDSDCVRCSGRGTLWEGICLECRGTGVDLYDRTGSRSRWWRRRNFCQINQCAYAMAGESQECECRMCRRHNGLPDEEDELNQVCGVCNMRHSDDNNNSDGEEEDSASDSSHSRLREQIDFDREFRLLVGYGCETCRRNRNGPLLDDYEGVLQFLTYRMPYSVRYNAASPDEPPTVVPSAWAEFDAAEVVANTADLDDRIAEHGSDQELESLCFECFGGNGYLWGFNGIEELPGGWPLNTDEDSDEDSDEDLDEDSDDSSDDDPDRDSDQDLELDLERVPEEERHLPEPPSQEARPPSSRWANLLRME